MKFMTPIIAIILLMAQIGLASYVDEDFEGYENGGTDDYYYYTDSTGDNAYQMTVYDLVYDLDETKAAYANINSGNLVPGDWIYVETWNQIKDSASAQWMQYDLAMAVNQPVADANPDNTSLVNEVWYYIYVDSDGDGIDDKYFETRVTAAGETWSPLNSHEMLQSYPRRHFKGEDAVTWDEYDPNTWLPRGNTFIPSADLGKLSAVGVQIRTDSFDTAGETNYMSVWVDEITVVPEPTTLTLLLGALVAIATGRRPARRRNG